MTTAARAREDSSSEPSSEARSLEASPAATASRVDDSTDNRNAEQPKVSGDAALVEFEAATVLPQVLKIVGSVVAPTTLLTALLFYFGLMYAIGYYRYFGVNFTALNLPFQDYLIMSVGASIIPLIFLTGVMLAVLWLYQLPLGQLSAQARRIALHVLMPSTATVGLALVSPAMVDAWHPVFPSAFPPESRGLSLSAGVLLLAYAARLRRMLAAGRQPAHSPPGVPVGMVVAKCGAVFILVSIGLFWAVQSYAINAGETEAHGLEADLHCTQDVVIFSEKNLDLRASGVRVVTGENSDGADRFRYEGLKLVPLSGNQYLFLPSGWTHTDGVAMLLPRSEALRLEFSWAGQVRDATC